MSKPTSQSTSNPWEALLASATRTRPPTAQTSTDTSLKGGYSYTILLQHSMTPKSQRQWALESTIANVDNTTNSSSAGLSSKFTSSVSIQSTHHANRHTSSSASRRAGGDWYGMSGPFLIRQAFQDLCKKCSGRVVLVSVSGTSGVWDTDREDSHDANIDDGDVYNFRQSSSEDGNVLNSKTLFRRNGACVDLSSNPFGWNDENDTLNASSTQATLNNLQSIATAIRQAASNINSSDETQQQPIPIIFDSLTPLLHIHGAERITILFKSLGRTTSMPSFDKSNITSLSVLSPIIAPVLYESISLSDHRTLEDCADAMVSLNLMDSTNNNSTNFAVEGKDDNSISVASGVMDLVRRGGGGANSGLGGKLMRHCVSVHIFRSLSVAGDLRDGCYWIIDGGDNDNGNSESNDDINDKKGKKNHITTASSTSSEGEMGKSQQESDPKSLSRPKIYLEDDDPDFQDYDEDDDLDL